MSEVALAPEPENFEFGDFSWLRGGNSVLSNIMTEIFKTDKSMYKSMTTMFPAIEADKFYPTIQDKSDAENNRALFFARIQCELYFAKLHLLTIFAAVMVCENSLRNFSPGFFPDNSTQIYDPNEDDEDEEDDVLTRLGKSNDLTQMVKYFRRNPKCISIIDDDFLSKEDTTKQTLFNEMFVNIESVESSIMSVESSARRNWLLFLSVVIIIGFNAEFEYCHRVHIVPYFPHERCLFITYKINITDTFDQEICVRFNTIVNALIDDINDEIRRNNENNIERRSCVGSACRAVGSACRAVSNVVGSVVSGVVGSRRGTRVAPHPFDATTRVGGRKSKKMRNNKSKKMRNKKQKKTNRRLPKRKTLKKRKAN